MNARIIAGQTLYAKDSRNVLQWQSIAGHGIAGGSEFWDRPTDSCQYLTKEYATRQAALIDVVQEFDPRTAISLHDAATCATEQISARGLTLALIPNTYPNADHMLVSA